jgi:hypothetical protein
MPDSTSTPWVLVELDTHEAAVQHAQVPIPAPCIAALTVLCAAVDTRERTPARQIEQTPVLLPGNGQPRGRSLRTLIQVPAGLPWAQEHRPERAVLAATDLEARPPDGTLVAAGSRAERQTCTRLRSLCRCVPNRRSRAHGDCDYPSPTRALPCRSARLRGSPVWQRAGPTNRSHQ